MPNHYGRQQTSRGRRRVSRSNMTKRGVGSSRPSSRSTIGGTRRSAQRVRTQSQRRVSRSVVRTPGARARRSTMVRSNAHMHGGNIYNKINYSNASGNVNFWLGDSASVDEASPYNCPHGYFSKECQAVKNSDQVVIRSVPFSNGSTHSG